jgi:hypothetical protein
MAFQSANGGGNIAVAIYRWAALFLTFLSIGGGAIAYVANDVADNRRALADLTKRVEDVATATTRWQQNEQNYDSEVRVVLQHIDDRITQHISGEKLRCYPPSPP